VPIESGYAQSVEVVELVLVAGRWEGGNAAEAVERHKHEPRSLDAGHEPLCKKTSQNLDDRVSLDRVVQVTNQNPWDSRAQFGADFLCELVERELARKLKKIERVSLK
jgi:hypothetical protein